MKGVSLLSAVAALAAPSLAFADIVAVGQFENAGNGDVHYQGDFAEFISSELRGDNDQYTVVSVDVGALLNSIGERAFISISVIDTGDNTYSTAPGADVDLFRLTGFNGGEPTYHYDGTTEAHQDETSSQLFQRVGELDWGTNGSGLGSMTFASLGRDGSLAMQWDEGQVIPGGQGIDPIILELSEAGSPERFLVQIETVAVPTPGGAAILLAAAAGARRRRRRR